MLVKIQSLIIAIYLFLVGIVYGDAPIKIDIDCTIPSGVYEYEVGDTIDFYVTTENVGRPFMGVTDKAIHISLYQIVNGKRVQIEEEPQNYEDITQFFPAELIKTGYKKDRSTSITISKDAVKGDCIVTVFAFGQEKVFESLVKIK